MVEIVALVPELNKINKNGHFWKVTQK